MLNLRMWSHSLAQISHERVCVYENKFSSKNGNRPLFVNKEA